MSIIQSIELKINIVKIRTGTKNVTATVLNISGFLNFGLIFMIQIISRYVRL